MGKEFKLSEKIVYDSSNWDIPRRIEIQDVKEFIKLGTEPLDSYNTYKRRDNTIRLNMTNAQIEENKLAVKNERERLKEELSLNWFNYFIDKKHLKLVLEIIDKQKLEKR